MAGEQGQRRTCDTVGQGQATEGDIVGRGVLASSDDTLTTQFDHEIDGHLDVHAHRDVVDEERQFGGLVQGAEVVLDLGRTGDRVERRGGDDGVDPDLLGLTNMTDDAQGLGVDDPGEQRYPSVDDPFGLSQDPSAHLVVEEGDLGGGTEDEQAVNPLLDEAIDELLVGDDVEITVGGQRGDDGGNDSMEVSGHGGVLRGVRDCCGECHADAMASWMEVIMASRCSTVASTGVWTLMPW